MTRGDYRRVRGASGEVRQHY